MNLSAFSLLQILNFAVSCQMKRVFDGTKNNPLSNRLERHTDVAYFAWLAFCVSKFIWLCNKQAGPRSKLLTGDKKRTERVFLEIKVRDCFQFPTHILKIASSIFIKDDINTFRFGFQTNYCVFIAWVLIYWYFCAEISRSLYCGGGRSRGRKL